MLAVGWMSVFAEKTLGSRLAVGVDYTPSAIESETKDTPTTDMTAGANTNTAVTQKIKVDFEDLTTIYVRLNLTDSLYVKAGSTSVDIITKEDLGTGSTYGNTSTDGTTVGVGFHNAMDNGMFIRAEANYMALDGVKMTGSNSHIIDVSDMHGATGSISIGKSF